MFHPRPLPLFPDARVQCAPSLLSRLRPHVSVCRKRGCWLCDYKPVRGGHCRVAVYCGERSVQVPVHRLMYEHFVGPIPSGLLLLHSCDVPNCCNPSHLHPGTHDENMAEMVARGRASSGVRLLPGFAVH